MVIVNRPLPCTPRRLVTLLYLLWLFFPQLQSGLRHVTATWALRSRTSKFAKVQGLVAASTTSVCRTGYAKAEELPTTSWCEDPARRNHGIRSEIAQKSATSVCIASLFMSLGLEFPSEHKLTSQFPIR
jgi:hypothetical protein